MDVLLQQIINGLVLGSMYALVALGYTMVYGIIGLINFAHGDVLMVGALTSWTIIGLMREASPGMPLWLVLLVATLIAMVVCAALNFTIEKLAYRPLRNSSRLAPLITAIGMSLLLQTIAMIIWKPNPKSYPSMLSSEPFEFGGAVISVTQVTILATTAITLAFLMLQLVSAGGIYPVETTAKPFQIIHPFDPMTYAVNGLRQLTVGGIDSRLWVSIAVLGGLLVASLGASSLAARRNRQWTMDRLHPPIEV